MVKHAILGAGGIGGLIGATLAHAGQPVTVIARRESVAAHPKQLVLEAGGRRLIAPVAVAAGWPDGGADILWVAVKATQLEAALDSLPAPGASSLRPRAVVPLLNGIDHVDLLRRHFGHDAVIPATIAVEAERLAPGIIAQRSPFARLKVASSGRDRLAAIEQLTAAGFECQFVDQEATLLWAKLVFLAPFALSTSAARDAIGEVLAVPERRALLHDSVREACAVATAAGARVTADSVIAMLDKLPASMRSSMQRDLAAKKPLELDAIAGPILRGAERFRLEVPATRTLVGRIAAATG